MTVRLFVHATGSVGCWNLPFWLMFLEDQHPDVELRVGLSATAATFVSPRTVATLTGHEPFIDTWEASTPTSPYGVSPHTAIAQGFDGFAVHPATMGFLSRLAAGSGDTPVLTALQTTSAPVAIAPAMPPGALRSTAVRRNLALLAEDPRLDVAETRTVASAATGEDTDTGPAPMGEVVARLLDRLRRQGTGAA